MRRPRLSQARKRARALLLEGNQLSPPVDVYRLVDLVGAQVRLEPYRDQGDLDGMLVRTSRGVVIGVNEHNPPTRQRFTIAHELGHLLLHTDQAVYFDEEIRVHRRDGQSSLATDPSEIEANQFAAELLMPAHMLRDELAHVDSFDIEADQTIRSLADKYEVSLQAMTIRLTVLGFLR